MPAVIYKQTLSVGINHVKLPPGGKLLSARFQRDEMQIWYSFDPTGKGDAAEMLVKVNVTGTYFDDSGWTYLATDMSKDHSFVGHVYYRPA